MPQALLIGGPLHGQTREVSGDRCKLTISERRVRGLSFFGFNTPGYVERETADYVRCEAQPRVYFWAGDETRTFEPDEADLEFVAERLAAGLD